MPDEEKKSGSTGQTILGSLPIVGQGLNALFQGIQNRKSRKWSEKMYSRQRADALADWNMQAAYNSPAEQMKRLKAAGLNPNLVYGNGADATMGGQVRSADAARPSFEAPQFDGGAVLASYYDTRLKEATVDNLHEQNVNIQKEAELKEAQIFATLAGIPKTQAETKSLEFKLMMDNKLKEIALQSADVGLQKQRADLQYTLDSNDRAAAQNKAGLLEKAEAILRSRAERSKIPAEIAHIRAQIENLRRDRDLKDLDIKLKQAGVQPSDNIILRAITQGKVLEGAKDLRNKYGLKLVDRYKKAGSDTWNEIKRRLKK